MPLRDAAASVSSRRGKRLVCWVTKTTGPYSTVTGQGGAEVAIS